MTGCLRFLWNRAESGDKNAHQIPTPKTSTEKAVYAALGGPNLDSFSSSAALNHTADSSQASEIHQRSFKHEAMGQENENDSKIDLDAAIRAVDVALAGLSVGGKRQGSPTGSKSPDASMSPPSTRTRPGCPPRAAVLRRGIRKFAKLVTPNPLQRNSFQDPFTNIQPVQEHPSSMHNSPDFMVNSGEMLNHQFPGGFINPADLRSNFSESDMSSAATAAALWANRNNSRTSDEWNVQQQIQHLINQNQSFTAASTQQQQNPMNRNWQPEFSNNPPPPMAKYMMNNAVQEFLMNSSDSWSSKIEVPYLNSSGRGDSFSSKIEYPINCDSFTSKMSAASIRDDSFSSQRVLDPLLMPNRQEVILNPANEAAYNLPELIRQELESLAEGDVTKEVQETTQIHTQSEAHIQSEKILLLGIAGILKSALMGNFSTSDLLSDLNFLLVAVRRHFLDFQSFSSTTAESFLLIGSTLPTVCLAAGFNEEFKSSLKRFLMMISNGHPSLNNAARLMDFSPISEVQSTQSNEAFLLLTRIHQRLSAEVNINKNQTVVSQSPAPFISQEMSSHMRSGSTIRLVDSSSESAASEGV